MKRKLVLACLVAMLIIPSFAAFSQESIAADSAPYEEFDNSIRFNAGGLVVGLLTGSLNIGVTYERRVEENLGIAAGIGFVQVSGASGAGVSVGVNYYFAETALHGWYGNVGGGVSVVTAYPYSLRQYSLGIGGGHQWVTSSSFVARIGGGLQYVTYAGIIPSLVISLGFAF